ncbi:MAG: TonB-dependent receptor, partial [Bacteroidota bacterium]|nr:TonB-dependent receptor [Bacteroidota bacterium]
MKRIWIMLIMLISIGNLSAQNKYIEGKITATDVSSEENSFPVLGVNIYWQGTTKGTTSNEEGYFKLEKPTGTKARLIVSYIGYNSDTIAISDSQAYLNIQLKGNEQIDEVTVFNRQKGNYLSKITAIQTETVTEAGLLKLPCCNLAESFENTATVDVGYADAVSGAKQIKMLGLAGKYSQILIEKKPAVRGLASNFGISYIPGTWMESIQVSKGTSSVIDGFESVSGQINVEYKKPENTDALHVNLYENHLGRMEANITTARKVSESWNTMLLFSGGHNNVKHDMNEDGFIDLPLSTQVHVMNRWKYNSHKNYKGQFGFTFL